MKSFIEKSKENIKVQSKKSKEKFNTYSNGKKIALVIGIVSILLAILFMFKYVDDNKYSVLFSNLEQQDAANISAELEKKGVSTKIEGNSIYVDKKEVDKLRLELAPTISDGSKGYELMDESSSIGLTDEEFQIKKQRMIQGEIEKTIKAFPQVENARVHISQGETSAFEEESIDGSAAVYLILKEGNSLNQNQVKSIISLVSGSTQSIPKENIDVIDQNMNLLSEGINKDEDNISSTLTLEESRSAESELNKKLELSILKMLEPIFGKGKVKATVNTNLNFDAVKVTDLTIKPDKVALEETKLKSTSTNASGGAGIDSNISNNQNENSEDETVEESFKYALGQTEEERISTPGEVKRITASVAIDGLVENAILKDVEGIVENAVGLDAKRGDSISVVAMEFDPIGKQEQEEQMLILQKEEMQRKIGKLIMLSIILIIFLTIGYLIYKKISDMKTQKLLHEINEVNKSTNFNELDNGTYTQNGVKKRNYIFNDIEEMTLEEEVKLYASEKPDQVTEIIRTWLSEEGSI